MEKQDNIKQAQEYLDARKWVLFLKALPVGISVWSINNYKDLVSLRCTAAGKVMKDYDKYFSITETVQDGEYCIEVKKKKVCANL